MMEPHGDLTRKNDGPQDSEAHCLSFLSRKSSGRDTAATIMMDDRRSCRSFALNE